jgi:aspartyl-tRNA(Asn)/glutamyl-tRNA(Gln) amidotransferase subunit C
MEDDKKIDLIRHLATLSRMELTESEEIRYAREIDEIVKFVGKISDVKISPKPLTTTISGIAHVVRGDVCVESKFADALLDAVPKKEGRMVRVPKIL